MTYHGGYEKAAPYYDLFDYKNNIDFFCQYAKEVSEILDIGAGTGRIAIPIAKGGTKVYCVEPSPAMITQFQMKLSRDSLRKDKIMLIRADASEFSLDKVFSVAILSGTFDHFLTDEERIAALTNIGNHLKENGKFILDIFLGLMTDSEQHPAGQVIQGNREYRRFTQSTVTSKSLLEVLLVYEIYENGDMIRRIKERSLVGVINRARVHELLNKTGFEIVREYRNFDCSDYREGDRLLILEVRKR
jgi:SAM-dependent methyltransferase